MDFPVILAHGALGPYDELIMLGAVVIFLIMMGISWVKSRNTRPEFEQTHEDDVQSAPLKQGHEPEHFRLD